MPSATAPVIFVSHGAPTLAIEPGRLGPQLQALGNELRGLNAVLVLSPHWQTQSVTVMTTAQPATVHDFGGFAQRLYTLQYPAAGHPELAQAAAQLLAAAGLPVQNDATRGLDHGAWVPLMHLLPQASVPVFQVSMPLDLTAHTAYALGLALAPLRAQGVLIVGSGSMTHNLRDYRPGAPPEPYAQEFTAWVHAAVLARQLERLLDYRAQAPHAQRAHPSEEHFLPLLIALGASTAQDPIGVLEAGISDAALSMESYVWGLH